MLEKLGKRAVVVPFMIPLLIFCILGLAMTPILRAEMNGIPFVVVSLDEGSELPFADVNVGDELVDRLLSGEGLGDVADSSDDSEGAFGNVTINWVRMDSEQELRDAIAANEYYGGIVIPANFTAQQMRSAAGLGGAPTLKVLLNDAKNPMLAQQMGPNLKSGMLPAGITVEIEELNSADIGGGTMAPMMAVQMLVMPLFIMTLISSILLSAVLWPRGGATRRMRLVALVKQIVVGALASVFIASLGIGVDVWFGGLSLPFEDLFPLVWLAVAAMMTALVGLCNFALPLGVLVGITTFALGMGCAMLAPEMLPPFWQEWVYPWAPQRFLGDGIRAVVYLHANPLAVNLSYWLTLFAVGGVAMLLALLVPARQKQEGMNPIEARKQKMAAMKAARQEKRAAMQAKRAALKAGHASRKPEQGTSPVLDATAEGR